MKTRFGQSNALDEREMQELQRIEHAGLWGMYGLLCAAVIVQLLMGAEFSQVAGELFVIAMSAVMLIAAYVRKGLWDTGARPSDRENALYALGTGIGTALLCAGKTHKLLASLCIGVCGFVLCFGLLHFLMLAVRKRQAQEESMMEEDTEE